MGAAAVRFDDVVVPMSDGACLAADVVTVDDGVPRPTLLVRTPYSRAGARAADDAVALARVGWSVVLQDVRGRFDSEGTFDPFRQEVADGHDTVEWCARQPWSDGRVVTWGASYVGATQMLAAAAAPPSLRGICPMVTAARYDDGWTYEGGALQLGFVLPWSILMASSDPRADAARLAEAASWTGRWGELYRTPLGSSPARALSVPFDRWLGQDPAGWEGTDVLDALRGVDVPGFHVAGWYDLFCDGSLEAWQALTDPRPDGRPRAPQRMVVGPWIHAGLFLDMTAEVDFGPAANGVATDVRGEALRWLRRAIDGEPVEGGLRAFVMGSGEWRDLDAWPPPSTPTDLWLESDVEGGGLSLDVPERPGVDGYRHDPDDPVPTRGGRSLGPFLPPAGPVDQRPIEGRSDVLVYTSEPLEGPLTILGDVTATIRFASSGRSADVAVKLVDVHPDGRALNVVDSVRRVDVPDDGPQDVVVHLGATAMCFLTGHRVRVHVSSSNFPRLDRNPSDGTPAGAATVLHPADQRVHTGGPEGSRITLPVVAS